ncbi:MAG TPA: DinB family protein [Methylophilaceae bacterium]|nr:DinB family protein [Methylophilaceae bacterium]
MSRVSDIVLFARYNEWMNIKVYETAGQLSAEELLLDRKAFFGSILGSLNHIFIADMIWLKRFSHHPANHSALKVITAMQDPRSLDELRFINFSELTKQRHFLDSVILSWTAQLTEEDLEYVVHYRNMKGMPADKKLGSLLLHFFNHQTHHRGQVSTLLSQCGLDVGVTDLQALIPDAAD